MGVMLWGRKWDQLTCLSEESKRRAQKEAGRSRGRKEPVRFRRIMIACSGSNPSWMTTAMNEKQIEVGSQLFLW